MPSGDLAQQPALLPLSQELNPEDPLNKEAAKMLQNNKRQFEQSVQSSIVRGAYINNSYFPPCKA